MNYFGNLIGLAVDKVGKKKAVLELSTEVYFQMSTLKSHVSMSGQTGECKPTSKRQFHTYGKRRSQINIRMTMRLFSRNSERLLQMRVLEE